MNPQVKPSHYFKRKYADLNRFISYYYQVALATDAAERSGPELLEIGVGNGTVSHYLRKSGLRLTTCDIDASLEPDVVADVRSLPFAAERFDVVLACEILEHLPFEDFEPALGELRRIARRFVIISLPYRSSSFELVVKFPFLRTLLSRPLLNLFLRIPLIFRRAGPGAQHYWELDLLRYPPGRIRSIIGKHFRILREVRPVLQSYHHFFVLER